MYKHTNLNGHQQTQQELADSYSLQDHFVQLFGSVSSEMLSKVGLCSGSAMEHQDLRA